MVLMFEVLMTATSPAKHSWTNWINAMVCISKRSCVSNFYMKAGPL